LDGTYYGTWVSEIGLRVRVMLIILRSHYYWKWGFVLVENWCWIM